MDRGHYLLALEHQNIENGIIADKEFLMEILEINESLTGEITARTLNSIKGENDKIIMTLTEALIDAFKNKDLNRAKALLSKLKYYVNIEDKIKSLEIQRGIVK